MDTHLMLHNSIIHKVTYERRSLHDIQVSITNFHTKYIEYLIHELK